MASTDEAAKTEHLLRKAETILKQRTDRTLLVLERVLDNTNYLGCLRTAEILGIQNVWVVQLPRGHKKAQKQANGPGQGQGSGKGQQQGQGAGQGGVGKRRRGNKRKHNDTDQQQPDAANQQEAAAPTDDSTDQQQAEGQPEPSGSAPAAVSREMDDEDQPADETMTAQDAGDEAVDGVPVELVGLEEGDVAEDKLRQEIRKRLRFSRASSQWLDVRFFWSVDSCIAALKQEGWAIWATDLSKCSVCLTSSPALDPLPDKVAIVMGREADGVSKEMLAQADRRVYLPMFGFTASLNVMVATGMVLQAMLTRWPEIRGHMTQERRDALRLDWYGKLARNEAQKPALVARAANPPAPYDDEDMKDLVAVSGEQPAEADQTAEEQGAE